MKHTLMYSNEDCPVDNRAYNVPVGHRYQHDIPILFPLQPCNAATLQL